MSVANIAASTLFNYSTQDSTNRRKQIQQEFQQLGQDLQAGNLTAAQSDFATLQKLVPTSSSSSSSATSTNSLAQDFSHLSQDLKAGNLTASQQDFSNLQQDYEGHAVHHHHHHGVRPNAEQSAISQLFSQLGQALQAGNLSSAQQAYSSLQQSFLQSGQSSLTTSSPGSVSVSA